MINPKFVEYLGMNDILSGMNDKLSGMKSAKHSSEHSISIM